MAGSQSGVNQSIGGGVVKLSPEWNPLSPPITGFTGMGIDGVGSGDCRNAGQGLDHEFQRENLVKAAGPSLIRSAPTWRPSALSMAAISSWIFGTLTGTLAACP